MVRQELKEANLPGEVSDSEALRYYEERPELFNGDRVSSVSVSTLVVEDPGGTVLRQGPWHERRRILRTGEQTLR